MEPNLPKVICVLGMHRSGTSMLMRILNICGVYIGEGDMLIGGDSSNQPGHWEHREISSINRSILERFAGDWKNPPDFAEAWENDPRLDDLVEKAENIVGNFQDTGRVWGFKDPRTCITFPFWKKIIPSEILILVPYRNHLGVAESLQKRNQMPLLNGILLWSKYWKRILNNIEQEKHIFVHCDDLISDWKIELNKIETFVNDPQFRMSGHETEIEKFIKPPLFHGKLLESSKTSQGNESFSSFIASELFNVIDTLDGMNRKSVSQNINTSTSKKSWIGKIFNC